MKLSGDSRRESRCYLFCATITHQYILVYTMLLERLCDAFEKEALPYALVGGFAVALLGAPRGTLDIDCIIRHTEEDFEKCERALRGLGFQPRLPVTAKEVFQFRKEYIAKRNLIAWSFVNPLQSDRGHRYYHHPRP